MDNKHEEEEEEEFQGDHLMTPATSFSQLLFGDDHVDHHHPHHNHTLLSSSLFSIGNGNTPKILCFENYQSNQGELLVSQTNAITPPKSVITSSESSSASSSANHKSNKKRNGLGHESAGCRDSVVKAAAGGRRQPKKTKVENPASTGHAKRREKLGERIAALQQLVSPFGKTDTASVLHEAMGYIRFLHDQVQVLCSPYLQGLPSSPHYHHHRPGDGVTRREEAKGELSGRGLCLIPVESTVHVASSNGADFWSPAMGNNVSSSTRY